MNVPANNGGGSHAMIAGLDWLNPVLVREYQQVMRSRAFVHICTVWMIAQLVAGWLFIGWSDMQTMVLGEGVGMDYFQWLVWELAIVVVILVPISSYARLAREKREATWELVAITEITTGQLLRGFYTVALAQTALFVFMALPFLVCAYMLRGLSLGTICEWLCVVIIAGVCSESFALMGAACEGEKHPWLCRIAAVFMVGVIVFFGILIAIALPSPWPLSVRFLVVAVFWCFGCFAMTMNFLTAQRREYGPTHPVANEIYVWALLGLVGVWA